jgi:hypothetical protein
MEIEKELAEELHECFCNKNHTDECCWGWEGVHEDKWERYTHKRYLNKAKKLLELSPEIKKETIRNIGFVLRMY